MNKILTQQEWHQSVADAFASAVESAYRDMVEKAVAAEREACAKVCDNFAHQDETGYGVAEDCAAAIRARGTRAEPPFIDPRGSLGEPIV